MTEQNVSACFLMATLLLLKYHALLFQRYSDTTYMHENYNLNKEILNMELQEFDSQNRKILSKAAA